MTVITAFCSSGTGKTTLLTHLAYYAATNNISTALIELDNRNSLKRCCGLPNSEFTTSNILIRVLKEIMIFYPFGNPILKGKQKSAKLIERVF